MAGNQIASNFEAIFAKTESTYGTDPTPGVGDGMDIRGDVSTSVDRVIVERARVHAKESRVAHGVIDDRINYSFSCAIGGIKQVDGGVPGVSPLLIGGGMSVATAGTEAGGNLSAVYTPTTAGKGSCTIYRHLIDRTSGQQVRLKLLGCRHNIEIVVAPNSELIMNVTGLALYAEWEAAASLTDPTTYGAGIASFLCSGFTHTFNGTARRITAFNFATNYALGSEDSVTGSSNIQEVTLHRPPGQPAGGSINPVALSTDFAASSSLVAESRAGTAGAHVLSMNDGVSTIAYSGPNAQIGNLPLSNDGAFKRFDVPYMLNDNGSGDDEYSWTFGEV